MFVLPILSGSVDGWLQKHVVMSSVNCVLYAGRLELMSKTCYVRQVGNVVNVLREQGGFVIVQYNI